MKNLIGYIVIGLLLIIGITEVIVIGKSVYRHVTEPKQEVEKANYHDSAVVIGEYMILQHNGWTAH